MARYARTVVLIGITRDRSEGRVTASRKGHPVVDYWPGEADREVLLTSAEHNLRVLAAAGAHEVSRGRRARSGAVPRRLPGPQVPNSGTQFGMRDARYLCSRSLTVRGLDACADTDYSSCCGDTFLLKGASPFPCRLAPSTRPALASARRCRVRWTRASRPGWRACAGWASTSTARPWAQRTRWARRLCFCLKGKRHSLSTANLQ